MVSSVQAEPARRHRRRRQDSEQEILEAAARLLRERRFRELTVDDLMAATSQSRTAFYRHFTDRQDLLVHLIGDLNEELWEMSAGWLRGSGDPLAEGRESLERLADVYAAHGPLLTSRVSTAGWSRASSTRPRPASAATPPPGGPAWTTPSTSPPPWSG
jgi:AcrR family transcriptional regulator